MTQTARDQTYSVSPGRSLARLSLTVFCPKREILAPRRQKTPQNSRSLREYNTAKIKQYIGKTNGIFTATQHHFPRKQQTQLCRDLFPDRENGLFFFTRVFYSFRSSMPVMVVYSLNWLQENFFFFPAWR